jgi:hypothetical protein
MFRSVDAVFSGRSISDLVAGLTPPRLRSLNKWRRSDSATSHLRSAFSPLRRGRSALRCSVATAFFPAAPILLSRRSSPAAWHYWPHPGSSDYQALAAALPLMAGAVLVAGSLFRLGWIANLLSIPATIGFLARISVHIVASQIPAVLGLAGQSFLSKTVAHTAAILVAACTGKMMRNRTFARDNYCRQEIVVCGSRKRCTLRSSILRLCPHRLTVVPKLCLGRLAQASCDPL